MDVEESTIEEGDKEGKLQPLKTYAYKGICFTTYKGETIECLDKEQAKGVRWYNELKSINVDLNQDNNPLNIIVDKSKWKTKIKNNTFEINVSTLAYININLTSFNLKEIEESLNNHIKKEIEDTLLLGYQKNIDIYKLNDYAYRNKESIKYHLENVKIKVESNIKNSTYYKY